MVERWREKVVGNLRLQLPCLKRNSTPSRGKSTWIVLPHATCNLSCLLLFCFLYNPLCPCCCCVFIYGINIVKVPSDSPASLQFSLAYLNPNPCSSLGSQFQSQCQFLGLINCRFVGALGVVSLVVSVVLPAIVFVVIIVVVVLHTYTYTHICTLHCHEQSQRLFGNCLTVVPCACASACCSNRFLATVPASYIHPPTIHTSSPSLLSLPLSVLSSSSPLLCPVLFSVLFCCYCCTVGNLQQVCNNTKAILCIISFQRYTVSAIN